MCVFNFEKLLAWQKAIALAEFVYSITRRFPDVERYGLVSQMRRAAVSIPSNIAEGCSRHSSVDQRRFYEFATGSLFEVMSQAAIGHRQQLISEDDYVALRAMAFEQSRMLSGLRKAGGEGKVESWGKVES